MRINCKGEQYYDGMRADNHRLQWQISRQHHHIVRHLELAYIALINENQYGEEREHIRIRVQSIVWRRFKIVNLQRHLQPETSA